VGTVGAAGGAVVDLIGEDGLDHPVAALGRHRDDLDPGRARDVAGHQAVELVEGGELDGPAILLGRGDQLLHGVVGAVDVGDERFLELVDHGHVGEVLDTVLEVEELRLESEGGSRVKVVEVVATMV
jgi:hypothetical protein